MILTELKMNPNTKINASLPSDFSSFLYVIEGAAEVGSDNKLMSKDQVGWLNRTDVPAESELQITAGSEGARLVLYAAQPQHHEIVSHGPFIADSMDDIRQLYSDYRSGRMGHIHDVPKEHQFVY